MITNNCSIEIDVVIPAYNVDAYIEQSIESVLRQTLLPKSIIVVDDCSTDNTADVVRRFGKRVKLIQHSSNKGISGARNTGIKASESPLVAFLDADDAWTSEKLYFQVQDFDRTPEIGLSYTSLIICDINLIPVGVRRFRNRSAENVFNELYLNAFPIPPSTVIVRRKVFEECDLFNENMPTGEDYECWLRIAMKFPISCTSMALCLRRDSPSSISSSMKFNRYMSSTFRTFELCGEMAAKQGIKLPLSVEKRKKLSIYRGFQEAIRSGREDGAAFFYGKLAESGDLSVKNMMLYKIFNSADVVASFKKKYFETIWNFGLAIRHAKNRYNIDLVSKREINNAKI